MQERLWMTEPRRATCLASVTEVQGERFTLDRALFAPRSRACRHPQYADEGTLWWEGEKRRLGSVEERGGRVWYTLRGTVPDVGVQLQCQIDGEVRLLASRAHTAMHLALAALRAADGPPLTEDPEVKGGGHFRLTLAWSASALVAPVAKQVAAWVAADFEVKRAFAEKAKVARLATPQEFQPPDPVPGPEVLPLVQVGPACVYPCDGTHVERTGRVGRVVLEPTPGAGLVWMGRVE